MFSAEDKLLKNECNTEKDWRYKYWLISAMKTKRKSNSKYELMAFHPHLLLLRCLGVCTCQSWFVQEREVGVQNTKQKKSIFKRENKNCVTHSDANSLCGFTSLKTIVQTGGIYIDNITHVLKLVCCHVPPKLSSVKMFQVLFCKFMARISLLSTLLYSGTGIILLKYIQWWQKRLEDKGQG